MALIANRLRTSKRASTVALKRLQARLRHRRWSRVGLPIVFGNAMPKSGSHILSQFLEGLSHITPLVYTDIHPIRTLTVEGRERSQAELLRDLRALKPGDIGWGYLRATRENLYALTRPGHVTYFAYRDPRDAIVSHIFYAMDMHPGHRLRPYYAGHLSTMDERIAATIAGIQEAGYSFPDVRSDYERYLPWLEHEAVLGVRFEDLVHRRDETLDRMLDFLERSGLEVPVDRLEAKRVLNETMAPSRSPTFRTGTSGGWREHFSDDNKQLFKDVAGDLLLKLGYERSDDW